MAKPIKELKTLLGMTELREAAKNAKAPQAGFFSTLDELIQQAPVPDDAKAQQWEEYLRPGRALVKEDVTFPLKAEELQYANLPAMLARLKAENATLNRNVLLDYVRENRPGFRTAPHMELGQRSFDSQQQFEQQYPDTDRLKLPFRVAQSRIPDQPSAARYADPALSHIQQAIPGGYEESVTNMDDLVQRSHFGPDALSWSRTTRHQDFDNGDPATLRLIEELQSDLHSKAAEKIRRAPPVSEDRQWWADLYQKNPMLYDAPYDLRQGGDPDRPRFVPEGQIEEFNRRLHTMQAGVNIHGSERRGQLEAIAPMVNALPAERRGYRKQYIREIEDFAKAMGIDNLEEAARRFENSGVHLGKNIEDAARGAVPDAPFKNPADYSLLELKKQLINSAYAGDTYLGATSPAMQIRRYEQGMGEKERAGMEHIYGKIVPGELERLARQYGIPTQELEFETEGARQNIRPQLLVNRRVERPDELLGRMLFHDFKNQGKVPPELDVIDDLVKGDYAQGYKPHRETVERFVKRVRSGETDLNSQSKGLDAQLEDVGEALRNLHEEWQMDNQSPFTYDKLKVMKLSDQLREKVKRLGVPLWTLPAGAVGAEAVIGNQEEPQGYAGGGVVTKGLKELKRSMADPEIRREMWRNSKAPAPGMFSTLDELIQAAPIPDEATAKQWEEYLRPGRALVREDVTFPLKAEELEYTNLKPFLENLKRQNALLNRNQLLEYIRQERPEFRGEVGAPNVFRSLGEFMGDDLGPQETSFSDKYHAGGEDIDDRSGLTGRVLTARLPKFGHDGLYTSSTAVPGSYEEMITRIDGLNQGYGNHFGADALSWSRASQQLVNLDSQKMRYIEEIQSDLHSKAGEKVYDLSGDDELRHALHRLNSTMLPEEYEPAVRNLEKTVQGFDNFAEKYGMSPEGDAEAQRIGGILNRLRELTPTRRGYYKNINRQVRDFAKARGINDVEEAYRLFGEQNGVDPQKLAAMENEHITRGAMPDAPFKSPADHGLLELKKQMLNAARQGDDYLGIIPGSEQIKRYEQGMDERRRGGMEYIYDKVYPGQLEKLARQYGIGTETVGMPTSQEIDARAPELLEAGLETPSELVSMLEDGDVNTADVVHATMRDLYNARYKDLDGIAPEHRQIVEAFLNDPQKMIQDIGPNPRRSPLANRLMLALESMNDEYRFQTAFETGDGSGYKTMPVPVMRLTPEAREKIKRVGVPLWTLPAATVGAEAMMGDQDEPQGYATGGLVKEAGRAKARAADRLGELIDRLKAKNTFVGQRAERVLDEEPGMDKMLSPEGLRRLAMDPAPIIMARPGEYRKWAAPFYGQGRTENGVPDIDRDMALELLVKMSESGGMRSPPIIQGKSFGPENEMYITGHNGRHRALGVGEIMGMKTPTQLDRYMLWPKEKHVTGQPELAMPGMRTTAREEMRADPDDGGDPSYTFVQPDVTGGNLTEQLQELLGTLNSRIDTIEQQNETIGQPERKMKIKPGRWFADGGTVKKIDRLARKAGVPGESEERRARLASAMMANAMSLDENGEPTMDVLPKFDLLQAGFTWPNKPGLVDGTLALGELLGIGGGLTEGSGERYNALVAKLQELQGLKEADTLPEHLTEALGSMLTQIPVVSQAGKVPKALDFLADYISPQVVPKVSNYLGGALAGGTLSKALQELNERFSGGPKQAPGKVLGAPSLEWDPGR